MLKKSFMVFTAVIALVAALWGIDILQDRRYEVAVVEPARMYLLPPHEYPKENSVVEVLSPGKHIHVLRVRYGKDFESLNVETDEGQTGWVITGEGVKVLSRGR